MPTIKVLPPEEEHHALLLSLAASVIDSLAEVQVSDVRQAESQALLEKILQHAITMRLLHNRSITLPLATEGITRYDFPSAIVLCRALFETYLTLHDVFLSPSSEGEFNFRYNLWRIRGLVSLQTFEPITSPGSEKYQELMLKLSDCRTILAGTANFLALTKGQKKVALEKGKDESASSRDYASAGFAPRAFAVIYGYTSSYVHADGHAAFQIRSAKSHKDQRQMFEMVLSISEIVLAKVILEFADRFPPCAQACHAIPGGRVIAEIYSGLAMKIGEPLPKPQHQG